MHATSAPTLWFILIRRGAVALAAALLVALASRPVGAAPMLDAPTEVIIPSGQTAGSTAISWSGVTERMILTLAKMGAADMPYGEVMRASGTFTNVPVDCCTTYTAKLFQADTEGNPIGQPQATDTFVTKHPGIKLGPGGNVDFGCLFQCITQVLIEPHGTFAGFTVKTSELVLMTLQASPKHWSPTGDSFWSSPSDVVSFAGTILPVTAGKAWEPNLLDLEPNTKYFYVLTAEDTNGHIAHKVGTFKTKKRQVTVTFESIHLWWDSDWGWGNDECECGFGFFVNGKPIDFWENDDFEQGTDAAVGITTTVANAPATLTIRAVGWDYDQVFGGGWFCDWATDYQECGDDYAEVTTHFNVAHGTHDECGPKYCPWGDHTGLDEEYTTEEWMASLQWGTTDLDDSDHDLWFEVLVKYSVKYV